jgi:hypothetical protein
MDAVTRAIWKRFNIKRGDTLPFSCWGGAPTRNDLAKLFAELGYTYGAETGVANGRYSVVLCQSIPNLHLLCVDPWKAYDRISQEKQDQRRKNAIAALTPFNCTFIEKPSMEAVREIPENSLDFVFIDGAHQFDYVMMDIIEWSKRVRQGGIVSGHDYYSFYQAGVVQAVNAYTYAHNIINWYVTRERETTWFWVKNYA